MTFLYYSLFCIIVGITRGCMLFYSKQSVMVLNNVIIYDDRYIVCVIWTWKMDLSWSFVTSFHNFQKKGCWCKASVVLWLILNCMSWDMTPHWINYNSTSHIIVCQEIVSCSLPLYPSHSHTHTHTHARTHISTHMCTQSEPQVCAQPRPASHFLS